MSNNMYKGCPLPPYNATNFNSSNAEVYNTLLINAQTMPNYVLPPQSDAQQIYRNQANMNYFQYINTQTSLAVNQNQNPNAKVPYPTFKSESDRINYLQAQTLTASRNKFTGTNPTLPAGLTCTTLYNIINE